MPRQAILKNDFYTKVMNLIDLGVRTPTGIADTLDMYKDKLNGEKVPNVELVIMKLKNIAGKEYQFLTKQKIGRQVFYDVDIPGMMYHIITNILKIDSKEKFWENNELNHMFELYLKVVFESIRDKISRKKARQEHYKYPTLEEIFHNFIMGIGIAEFTKKKSKTKGMTKRDWYVMETLALECRSYFVETFKNNLSNISWVIYNKVNN